MSETSGFVTSIKKVEPTGNTTCFFCGALGLHPYVDPEANGSCCRNCLPSVIASEKLLVSTKGIKRPEIHEPGT